MLQKERKKSRTEHKQQDMLLVAASWKMEKDLIIKIAIEADRVTSTRRRRRFLYRPKRNAANCAAPVSTARNLPYFPKRFCAFTYGIYIYNYLFIYWKVENYIQDFGSTIFLLFFKIYFPLYLFFGNAFPTRLSLFLFPCQSIIFFFFRLQFSRIRYA